MRRLMMTDVEKNGFRVTNIRLQPLITWFHFLNFATIAILCLFMLRIYKTLTHLYRWIFPFKDVSKYPIILVLGPKNDIIQEIVHQLSQTFNSEVRLCQDLNFNSSEVSRQRKTFKKSQIIYSEMPISSQEMVTKLKTYILETFGFVDILVISQNEDSRGKTSTQDFLKNLNKQLLAQFWTVMAFLPGMLRQNRGHILSVALGRASLTNTGIMRSIHEELLQCDTKVRLTLVESNPMLDKSYMPSLSSAVLASFIVRSMWDSSSLVKVPSLPFYLIMLPVLLIKFLLKSVIKIISFASAKCF